MMNQIDGIFPLLLEMNTKLGSRIINVQEQEILYNHKIDSVMLRNNDD